MDLKYPLQGLYTMSCKITNVKFKKKLYGSHVCKVTFKHLPSCKVNLLKQLFSGGLLLFSSHRPPCKVSVIFKTLSPQIFPTAIHHCCVDKCNICSKCCKCNWRILFHLPINIKKVN